MNHWEIISVVVGSTVFGMIFGFQLCKVRICHDITSRLLTFEFDGKTANEIMDAAFPGTWEKVQRECAEEEDGIGRSL